MRILDGHIHIREERDEYSAFWKDLAASDVSGGIVLSLPPGGYLGCEETQTAENRMQGVLRCTNGHPDLHPFFWIDPVGREAAGDVALAIDAGARGFKVICSSFYPADPRALATYRLIAAADLPILFHSGILWDGQSSSRFNRPAEFEGLISVEGLRFSLAHISWPWCDELIAVYGKFLASSESNVELFIDTTPGTPPIYRKEALTKLFTVGYDVEHNVFFGSDSGAPDYNGEWTREWVARDTSILRELGVSDEVIRRVFSTNLERFVGVSDAKVSRRALSPGK